MNYEELKANLILILQLSDRLDGLLVAQAEALPLSNGERNVLELYIDINRSISQEANNARTQIPNVSLISRHP